MIVLDHFAHRLRSLAGFLENSHARAQIIRNPHLLLLRQRGGSIGLFLTLDKPWLRNLRLKTVLDIGANEGQFAVTINALLPKAQIYSFEPLPASFALLERNMTGVQGFRAFNLALGSEAGELSIEQQHFTAASSFLPMTKLHKDAFPYAYKRGSSMTRVRVDRLDTVMAGCPAQDGLLIKIDVQGFEDRVLRGGEQTVRRAEVLIVETSIAALYAGQPLFDDVYGQLLEWGFQYAGSLDQTYHPKDGRVLQVDSIFLRKG